MTDSEIRPDPERSEAIRRRALAVARAHRHRSPDELTAHMAELGRRNAAERAANRDRISSHDARMDANRLRINRTHALAHITTGFAEYRDAQPDFPPVAAWVADTTAERTRDWLVLLGPTGVGKTWQAIGAYTAVIRDLGCDGYAVRAPALLNRAMPGETDRINWTLVETCDLLLLDDVPGGLSEWDRRTLFRAIDTRQGAGRRTIVTTNLRPEHVREQLGDQLASRLSHHARVVAMTGPDRRTAR
jgi:DNA replication protein DnaC